jgi:hypothetical protein
MRIRLNHTTLAMGSGVVIIILTSLALATDPSSVRNDQKAHATPDVSNSSSFQPSSLSVGMPFGVTPPLYLQLTWVAMAQTHSFQATHQATPGGGLENLPLCSDEVLTPSLTDTPVSDASNAPATCRLNSVEYVGAGPVSLPCCGTLAPYVQLTWTPVALTPVPQVTSDGGWWENLPLCSDALLTPSLTATPVPDDNAPTTCRLNFVEHVGSGPP